MSSFAPLNLTEDPSISKKDLEEEYSRELAIEEAFKTFQSALSLHRNSQFVDAYFQYQKLFKVEVLANHYYEEADYLQGIQNGGGSFDETSLISPNVKSLRYLSFRNRGFLLLDILSRPATVEEIFNRQTKSEEDDGLVRDLFKELFYVMVDDFVISLVYQDGDAKLVHTIYEIFVYLDVPRLVRFTLEYGLSQDESDDVLGLIPLNPDTLNRYNEFLGTIHEKDVLKTTDDRIKEKYAFLQPIKDDFEAQIENIKRTKTVTVSIAISGWNSVITDIDKEIKKHHDSEKLLELSRARMKDIDCYNFTELSIEHLEFVLEEKEEEVVEIETEPVEEVEVVDENDKTTKVQRSSRRLAKDENLDEVEVLELTPDSFKHTETFFTALNGFFARADCKLADLVKIYTKDDHKGTYLDDFVGALVGWGNVETNSLFASEEENASKFGDDEKSKLLEVLSTFGSLGPAQVAVSAIEEFETTEKIRGFLENLGSSKPHYEICKKNILQRLLGQNDGVCLITDTVWPPALSRNVREWILQLESYLYADMVLHKSNENYPFCVSIFEVFVDTYIGLKAQVNAGRPSNKSSKALLSNLVVDLVKFRDKIIKWKDLIGKLEPTDQKSLLRFQWADIFREKHQSSWEDNRYIAHRLQEIHPDQVVVYPNYEHISELSKEAVKYQATTASVLALFAKILYSEDGNNEAVQILEQILIEKSENEVVEPITPNETSIASIRVFLDKFPVDMKIKLWDILFLFYDESKQYEKFSAAFDRFVEFSVDFLEKNGHSGRGTVILQVLCTYGGHLETLLRHKRETESSSESSVLDQFISILNLCCLFNLHEEAAAKTSSKTSLKVRSPKSYRRMCDIFVQTLTLVFLNLQLKEFAYDLLLTIHEYLAYNGVCDGAGGVFLELAQRYLLHMDQPLRQLVQVIGCRFHYTVSLDQFTPAAHNTAKTGELDPQSTADLGRFLLPLFLQKNLLVHPPKTDMKGLVDGLYEVVGDPRFDSDETLALNNEVLKYFLDQTVVSPKFLRDAFYGLVKLDLAPPETGPLVRHGLYYLQALLMFNSYKVRKKSMQLRAVELEHIISLLHNDLIHCLNRSESWFLLGQAYGFLVEDDLIWTSDKLTMPDRKATTANLQRKSLLCYLMAINGTTEAARPIAGLVMASFAREAYAAALRPMDMLAFRVLAAPRLERAGFVAERPLRPAHRALVLRLVLLALLVAIKAAPNDWLNYYYLSKVQRKLDKAPSEVLLSLQKAARLAKSAQVPDPILEPHYRTCSLTFKYVRSGAMSPADALVVLNQNEMLAPGVNEVSLKTDFYHAVMASLRKLMSQDKKKWHHRPRYRLATILFEEFGDVSGAKDEMSSIISVKATSKTLVSIWKPEFERPGTHFCYTYQYTTFFITLLSKELNLITLVHMLPKLRRSNSTMVSLYQAWEFLCSTICKIIRSSLEVTETFTETFLLSYSYQSFISHSKSFVESLKKQVPERLYAHICFLHAVNDMKKYNNGFGPTSLIDDTIVAIYVRIFMFYEKNPVPQVELTDSPSGKPKKLAKRDVFPFVTDMLTNLRRDIEKVMNEHPDIYNEYVRREKTEGEVKVEVGEVTETAVTERKDTPVDLTVFEVKDETPTPINGVTGAGLGGPLTETIVIDSDPEGSKRGLEAEESVLKRIKTEKDEGKDEKEELNEEKENEAEETTEIFEDANEEIIEETNEETNEETK